MARSSSDSENSDTMEFKIEQEDCGRCGGAGEIVEAVAGRSGLVPCPSCDIIPKSALPNEVPDDPRDRLDTIEGELKALADRESEHETAVDALETARSSLSVARETDIFDAEEAAVLEFLEGAISSASRQSLEQVNREIHYNRRQLREEQDKLRTLLDAAASESEASDSREE